MTDTLPRLNPNLKEFWKTPARVRTLYGGRASGKSWDTAAVAILMSRFCNLKFMCCRQFQNKITDSVYSLLKNQIDRLGFSSEFEVLKNEIRHKKTGSIFVFYGIARSIEEIKSFEGIDILWIEEAGALTEDQWDILEPTLRKDHSQIWIIFNPGYITDFVYRRFVMNPRDGELVREINYPENPFLSNTILDTINKARETDYERYQHIFMGVPKDNDDSVIIKRSWIMSAIDAHKKLENLDWSGLGVAGYDVADDGGDANAITVMSGLVCTYLKEWKSSQDELLDSAKKVLGVVKDKELQHVTYDPIGVGAGTGSIFSEKKFYNYSTFHAGAKVKNPEKRYKDRDIKNKDFFLNLKAQGWWHVAERFKNTHNMIRGKQTFSASEMISLSSDIDQKLLGRLIDELSAPKAEYDASLKVKVESKKDLLKRGIPSPNLADSFIIANSLSITGRVSVSKML